MHEYVSSFTVLIVTLIFLPSGAWKSILKYIQICLYYVFIHHVSNLFSIVYTVVRTSDFENGENKVVSCISYFILGLLWAYLDDLEFLAERIKLIHVRAEQSRILVLMVDGPGGALEELVLNSPCFIFNYFYIFFYERGFIDIATPRSITFISKPWNSSERGREGRSIV